MSISQGISLAFLRSSAFLFASLAAILVSSAPECGAQEEEGNNYRLSANDLVEIRVYQEPDLDSRVRIGGDGSVTLPLVGTVRWEGKPLTRRPTTCGRNMTSASWSIPN